MRLLGINLTDPLGIAKLKSETEDLDQLFNGHQVHLELLNERCDLLEKENKKLKEQIEEMNKTIKKQVGDYAVFAHQVKAVASDLVKSLMDKID